MHKKNSWKLAVKGFETLNFCLLQTNKGQKRPAEKWQRSEN